MSHKKEVVVFSLSCRSCHAHYKWRCLPRGSRWTDPIRLPGLLPPVVNTMWRHWDAMTTKLTRCWMKWRRHKPISRRYDCADDMESPHRAPVKQWGETRFRNWASCFAYLSFPEFAPKSFEVHWEAQLEEKNTLEKQSRVWKLWRWYGLCWAV